MKTMTLEEYINNQPEPPAPVAAAPVRPCFGMHEGGLRRTRPGPTMLARSGALEEVARVIDAAAGVGCSPDDITRATALPAADAHVALSFLLFISAVVRDGHDLYRANCPCVEGEALSRLHALQDMDDTDDPAFGTVALGLPPAPPKPRLAE